MHRFLTNSPNLTRLRVRIVQYVEEDGEHAVIWSRTKGGGSSVDFGELIEIGMDADQIPVMPNLERLIFVQTSVDYEPKFLIGIENFTFEDMIFTLSRFGQGLCYSHNNKDAGRICPLDS